MSEDGSSVNETGFFQTRELKYPDFETDVHFSSEILVKRQIQMLLSSPKFALDTQALICLSGTSRGYYLTGGSIREVVPIWIQLVRIKRLEALGISNI